MAEQVKKAWYKKKWVWVIAILVLAVNWHCYITGETSRYPIIIPRLILLAFMENNQKDMQRYEIKRIRKGLL